MNISDASGKVLDQYTDRIGFRQFEYHTIGEALAVQSDGGAGTSFLLNGEEYPLYGAAMHGDYYGYGNAIEKEHWDTSFALINEIGMNTIRAAHYPYPQYFYDQCDERGYIVWAENAATNGVPKFDAFVDVDNYIHSAGQLNAFNQVLELVLQNYNHPSTCTWCLMNEVAARAAGTNRGSTMGLPPSIWSLCASWMNSSSQPIDIPTELFHLLPTSPLPELIISSSEMTTTPEAVLLT